MVRLFKIASTPFFVVGTVAASCGLFYAALRGLDLLSDRYEISLLGSYDFTDMIGVSVAIVGVNAVVLIVEWLNVGWRKCALKRLLFLETSTIRTDLFYLILRLSGLTHAISFVLSFGLVFVAARKLGQMIELNILADVQNVSIQLGVLVFVNTFVFYWAHRFMHTRGLFEIHKVHHSALELNVLTPTRNHPVDFLIMIIINTIPASILGADPVVITAYLGVNGLYQCAVHSDITFLENKFCRTLIITPKAHRVHHSKRTEHYDMNFGVLTLWDRLFGTYCPPTGEKEFQLGVKNDEDFNTDQPIKELWTVFARWLGALSKISGTARQ